MRQASLVLALAIAGCGSSAPASDAGTVPDAVAPSDAPASDVVMVELDTTTGPVVIEVHRSWAPNGVARFLELVESGYYDGNAFFRVVPGFMVQFGISGDPAVSSMWSTRTIPDDPVVGSNTRGVVSFAQTSAPNSRTTQLFISYADNSFLDPMGFAPIGRVVSGMDAIDAINAEYGEMPQQSRILAEGDAYLDATFPNLDAITTARAR